MSQAPDSFPFATNMDAESVISDLSRNVLFYPCQISEPYNLDGTFSSLNIQIKECEEDDKLVSLSLDNVFEIEEKSIEHFLTNFYPKVTNNKEHSKERTMFYNHVKNIFCHLGKNVTLQTDYKEMTTNDPTDNVTCSALGMGASTTWHGYPDGRIRGDSYSITDLIYSDDEGDGDSAETCLTAVLNESQGDSACIEAKLHCSPQNFPQLVATNIVASFIEHTLHAELNPAVPTLLINTNHFYISIYDCKSDLLLISNKISFRDEELELIPAGICMIWLTIHHR